MENYVIAIIVAAVVAFGIYSAVKHFRGQGGCCGGGSVIKTKRKKLPKIISQKTFKIDGMHCENCKNRIEEIINDMKGLSGRVDLKKCELTVSYAEEVADEVIKARLERAGYTVI